MYNINVMFLITLKLFFKNCWVCVIPDNACVGKKNIIGRYNIYLVSIEIHHLWSII